MHTGFKLLIGTSLYLVVFIIPALLLYYLGYVPREKWGAEAEVTLGRVDDTYVYEHLCLRSCHMGKNYQTCPYVCYDGKVLVTYTVNNVSYDGWLYACHSNSAASIENNLKEYYKTGSIIKIYYDPNRPADSALFVEESASFYIGFMCMTIIGSVLYWVFLMYIMYIEISRASNDVAALETTPIIVTYA